jgi:hypothetical protein
MKRLMRATDRLAHEAVQYISDTLLFVERMKRESRVKRRMPQH